MHEANGVCRRRVSSVQPIGELQAGRRRNAGPATRSMESERLPVQSVVRLTQVNIPVLLMNVPLSLSAQIPNNAWMEDMTPDKREIDLDRAIAQFAALYKHIAQHA